MSPSEASFVPYQIDHSVKNAAKTIGFSKKKVIFKFGFASENALREGLNGPACRGSEHELIFIWSLATGKRQILLDNKDVHYSESGQNGWTSDRAWQHTFSLRDSTGATFRISFSSQPTSKDIPNSRPFDLRIAGISYFRFNHIYQLGTPEMSIGHQSGNNNNNNNHNSSGRSRRNSGESMSPEERQQLERAKLESLKALQEQQEKQPTLERPPSPSPNQPLQRVEDSLINFDDDPKPSPVGLQQQMPMQSQYGNGNVPNNNPYASSMTMDSANFGGGGGVGTSGYGSSFAVNSSSTDTFFGGAQPTSSGMTSSFSNYSSTSNVASGSFSQIPASNSYTAGSAYGTNPYEQPSSTTNPYEQPSSTSNPYAQHPSTSNPYAQPSSTSNPYAQPPSTSNPYAQPPSNSNPYAQPPSTSNPYGQPPSTSNPYGQLSSTSNPYGQAPSTNNPYAVSAPVTDSLAITPYGGNNGNTSNPYVDATGRLSVGTESGFGNSMLSPAMNTYGYAAQPPGPSPYTTAASLTSPSNQSYGGQSSASQFSYGSAPSFAQPPQQQYQYAGGAAPGYASPPSMPPSQFQASQQSTSVSPYSNLATPSSMTSASPFSSFASPPPQQQQQQPSYGGAYGGY